MARDEKDPGRLTATQRNAVLRARRNRTAMQPESSEVIEPDLQKKMVDMLNGFSVDRIEVPQAAPERAAFDNTPVKIERPKIHYLATRSVSFQLNNPDQFQMTFYKLQTLLNKLPRIKLEGNPPQITGSKTITLTPTETTAAKIRKTKNKVLKNKDQEADVSTQYEFMLSMDVGSYISLCDAWGADKRKVPPQLLGGAAR